ncbi:aminotransferase class III-fold pyridoxal phosphate-dependent enzyme [Serratia symbiotica]|nr:aminotransferase class III-fold pyridoxal phosphate-dependent enzyme [Serratia symbiotica]
MWHLGNGYTNEPVLRLAKQLIFSDKVFLCNSGAEANEAALKLARNQAHDQYGSGKDQIVAFNNAFHGPHIVHCFRRRSANIFKRLCAVAGRYYPCAV